MSLQQELEELRREPHYMKEKTMPNEMRRPCTLPASWKQPNGRPIEPFDAIGATVLPSGRDMGVYTKDGRVIRFEFATREALEIGYMEAITTIAHALNAPVLATEEVLAGLPEGSDFLAHKVGYFPTWQLAFYCTESQKWWGEDERLDESYIIKSDGCSKTLARLLEFTLQGVRIKEGG